MKTTIKQLKQIILKEVQDIKSLWANKITDTQLVDLDKISITEDQLATLFDIAKVIKKQEEEFNGFDIKYAIRASGFSGDVQRVQFKLSAIKKYS